MAAFEFPCQRRVGRILRGGFDVEDLPVGAQAALGRHVEVGVALEALHDPPPNAVAVHGGLAIVVRGLRAPPKALLGAVHVVVEGHGGQRSSARSGGVRGCRRRRVGRQAVVLTHRIG
jgi:hypothetical protein